MEINFKFIQVTRIFQYNLPTDSRLFTKENLQTRENILN